MPDRRARLRQARGDNEHSNAALLHQRLDEVPGFRQPSAHSSSRSTTRPPHGLDRTTPWQPIACRTVTWHPNAIYLTILINLVVYLIVALCVRKTSHHTIYLARTERARRIRWQVVAWVAFTAGLAAIPLAISTDVVDVFWATPFCLIIAAIIYFIHGRLIHAERISDSTVAIRGRETGLTRFSRAFQPPCLTGYAIGALFRGGVCSFHHV